MVIKDFSFDRDLNLMLNLFFAVFVKNKNYLIVKIVNLKQVIDLDYKFFCKIK